MRASKRVLDIIGSVGGLIILLPLLAVIATAIKLDDSGPVLFRQERVGRGGRRFLIVKFRTMVVDADRRGLGLTVGKDPRITRIGTFLRRYKLDELPQLWNVLKGDMSLVGPRPEVPRYVAEYSPAQRRVLDLVPGITDPASVRYSRESDVLARSPDPEREYLETIMPEKIDLNLEYADRASLWSDLREIMRTFGRIVRSEDRR